VAQYELTVDAADCFVSGVSLKYAAYLTSLDTKSQEGVALPKDGCDDVAARKCNAPTDHCLPV